MWISTSPDRLPTMFNVAPAVTLLFQVSLLQGQILSDSSEALVAPLYKKGERNNASNYRPVSQTSVACKCLEHIVYCQIMAHFTASSMRLNMGFAKATDVNHSLFSPSMTWLKDWITGLKSMQYA